jgi:hypothetical protein
MRAYPKLLKLLITNTEAKKSVIYGKGGPDSSRVKRLKSGLGLNCTTPQANLAECVRRRIQSNSGIAKWSLDR